MRSPPPRRRRRPRRSPSPAGPRRARRAPRARGRMRRLPGERVPALASQILAQQRHPRAHRRPVERLARPHPVRHDQPSSPEQMHAELALPRQPPLARLQRELAQPRVAVRDPEDPRQRRPTAPAPRRRPRARATRAPRFAARTRSRARRFRAPTMTHPSPHVGLPHVADLQDIVDDLEAEILRPISVEDRRWRLLAHSAQPDETDPVRRSRSSAARPRPTWPPGSRASGCSGRASSSTCRRTPALGMTRRVVLPIRHGDVLLGFLWVIVGDRPLTDADRAALVRGAAEVADNLWGRLREADERRAASTRCSPRFTGGLAAELAAALRWPATGAYAVAVPRGGDEIAERLRRRRGAADFAWVAPRTTASSSSPAIPRRLRRRARHGRRGRRRQRPLRARSPHAPTRCARPRSRRSSPAPPRTLGPSRPTTSSAAGR